MTEKEIDVTIGADPELFVYDNELKRYVSAHDLLPGTKEDPAIVPRGAIQVDGVAAEFNITPATTRKEFMRNIKHVRRIAELMVKDKNKNYTLIEEPTATFDPKYFSCLPDNVLLLGCDPDYDAYTGAMNKAPYTELPIRTGAGHMHIGFLDKLIKNPFDKEHMLKCAALVRELDFVFEGASKEWDFDYQRRALYGNTGAFRPKPYGVEYRVLSNAWLRRDWSMMFVYDVCKSLATRWLKGFSILSEATKSGLKHDDDPFVLGKFLYSHHLPAIDSYSPRLEKMAIQKAMWTNPDGSPRMV